MAALAWPGRAQWKLPKLIKLGAWGAFLGGTALAASGVIEQADQLTSCTEPRKKAKLLTDGPYEVSRHPIYVGLLTASTGFAVLRRRVEPLIAVGILAQVLHEKVDREEAALHKKFGRKYRRYTARTSRLIGKRD